MAITRPVRLKHIAESLGLSVMAVSKALRGHNDISEKTRERVLDRARELGYRPNLLAQKLLSGRSHTLGMVVPNLIYSYFAELAQGVSHHLRRNGYQLHLCNSEDDVQLEREQVESLVDHQVEAIILASSSPLETDRDVEYLSKLGCPYVLVGRESQEFGAHCVSSDGVEIGRIATEHLWSRGCRRIAYIQGPALLGSARRRDGYLDAIRAKGANHHTRVAVGGDGIEAGQQGMRGLLESGERPDGVFCFNDSVAAGAMKAILAAGLRIPQDIAVVGVGNIMFSDILQVPLTTIDQHPATMGLEAAKLLLRFITEKTPPAGFHRLLIPATLLVRQSSGPA